MPHIIVLSSPSLEVLYRIITITRTSSQSHILEVMPKLDSVNKMHFKIKIQSHYSEFIHPNCINYRIIQYPSNADKR